jgi:hypothetical protein
MLEAKGLRDGIKSVSIHASLVSNCVAIFSRLTVTEYHLISLWSHLNYVQVVLIVNEDLSVALLFEMISYKARQVSFESHPDNFYAHSQI